MKSVVSFLTIMNVLLRLFPFPIFLIAAAVSTAADIDPALAAAEKARGIMTGNTGTLHANGTITEKPLNELKYESLSHRRFVDSRTLIWVPQHLP